MHTLFFLSRSLLLAPQLFRSLLSSRAHYPLLPRLRNPARQTLSVLSRRGMHREVKKNLPAFILFRCMEFRPRVFRKFRVVKIFFLYSNDTRFISMFRTKILACWSSGVSVFWEHTHFYIFFFEIFNRFPGQ